MLEIRKAHPGLFEKEIWPFFQPVAKAGETYPYSPDIAMEEARNAWFAPYAQVYIAYLNNIPVATRYIVPNKTGLGSHVANTGVMIGEKYRNNGLGKQMMEFALSECKKLGYRAIQLNLVVVRNEASIRICKRYGFDIIGILPEAFFYKQQEYIDALVMFKKL